jgi:release factor glutamine methyltransferase
MTPRALLTAAVPRLRRAGIDSPRLDAELLLGHVLGRPRAWLWAHLDDEVPPEPAETFAVLLGRRLRREPLAYILGEWEFYGRAFLVTPAVLVPRPETEMLVEAVLRWTDAHDAVTVADIGTGSGAIAVSLAAERPALRLIAVDLSADALEVARGNAARHGVGEHIDFRQGDLAEPLRGDAPLDVIVANLPYIDDEQLPDLMPEVRDFEPRLALAGGAGGLDLIRRLIAESDAVLRPGGLLALELGDGQADAVVELLRASGWREPRVIVDFGGIPRHILAEHA